MEQSGVGRVELGTNLTRWVMEATRGIDNYIVAGDMPAEILEKYVDATGHPPLLLDFALGFWQCKLRYLLRARGDRYHPPEGTRCCPRRSLLC